MLRLTRPPAKFGTTIVVKKCEKLDSDGKPVDAGVILLSDTMVSKVSVVENHQPRARTLEEIKTSIYPDGSELHIDLLDDNKREVKIHYVGATFFIACSGRLFDDHELRAIILHNKSLTKKRGTVRGSQAHFDAFIAFVKEGTYDYTYREAGTDIEKKEKCRFISRNQAKNGDIGLVFVNANDLDVRLLSNFDHVKNAPKSLVLEVLERRTHRVIGSGRRHLGDCEELLGALTIDMRHYDFLYKRVRSLYQSIQAKDLHTGGRVVDCVVFCPKLVGDTQISKKDEGGRFYLEPTVVWRHLELPYKNIFGCVLPPSQRSKVFCYEKKDDKGCWSFCQSKQPVPTSYIVPIARTQHPVDGFGPSKPTIKQLFEGIEGGYF